MIQRHCQNPRDFKATQGSSRATVALSRSTSHQCPSLMITALIAILCGCTGSVQSSGDDSKPDATVDMDVRLDALGPDEILSSDMFGEVSDSGEASDQALDVYFDDMGTPPDAEIEADLAFDAMVEPECQPDEVLARHGCASGGCHAPPVQANLDLTSPGFELSLLDAPSPTEGCEGRLLIDVQRPEQSLMLQVIGVSPPLGGVIDTCQTVMPPSGVMSEDDQACLTDWVHALAEEAQEDAPPPAPFEATPLFSAVRKVKTLLHGDILTAEELTQVRQNPSALRSLVTTWVETEAFDQKISDFLTVTLQQRRQTEDLQQFDRLRRSGQYSSGYIKVLEESFVRTALDIIKRNLPFTQIVTTRTWMVTTANLVLLRYPDQDPNERAQRHTVVSNPDDAPDTLSAQSEQRTWLIPSIESTCELNQPEALDMLFGTILARYCPGRSGRLRFNDSPLTPADFEDWRLVELVPTSEDPSLPLLPFYDIPSLREAERVATRLPRVGFFTTSVFFNNWATNIDNLFRVTTNQSLLVALNIGFSSSEPTSPLSADGLDNDHSDPTTACYGCHKTLDPMRLYFGQAFDVSYQLPSASPSAVSPFEDTLSPSFAFRNHSVDGGDLYTFAQALTDHPRFPYAWVQKLCLYANSERCDERDPLFIAIAERFRDEGYNFKQLVIELFSSPLVTGLAETESRRRSDPLISITRLNHLCPLLIERTGRADICEVSRVRAVKGLIARDDFARGSVDATQPALSSAFHFAAVEAICNAVSSYAVTRNSENFSHRDPEIISKIVTQFMGLPSDHERYEHTLNLLTAHYQALRDAGQNTTYSARSVFSLACMSPDVMGIGL